MRRAPLFTLLVACGAPGAVPAAPPTPPTPISHDAAIVAPATSPLGAACAGACPEGLTCLALTGGYCAAKCGETCGGACVETPALGDVCMASCVSDRDCRERDGYVCDPAWHACALPNTAAIVPRQCPTVGPAIDATFDFAEIVAAGRNPSAAGSDVAFEAGHGVAMHDRVLADDGDAPAVAAGLVAWRTKTGVQVSGFGVVSDDCGDCTAPPLLARNGPNVYALYGGADVGLRARRSRDGGKTFEPATAVARGIFGNAAVDRGGHLHLVTINGGVHGAYGSAMQTIEYAIDGGAPLVVSGRDDKLPTYFATPAIAVDDVRRAVWIAYVRGGRDADWELVIAVTRDGGKTWSRSRIGDGCAIHAVPAIAVDPKTGSLHVAYYDSDAMPGRFAHAICSTTCTVLGAIPGPRFAAFGLGRGGARSLGEHAALVFDRGKLNAYWTQPLLDGVHVMHASAH